MRTIDVQVGDRTITIERLSSLVQLKEFDDAVREVFVEWAAWTRDGRDSSTDWLGACARLIKLGAPDVATDELLDACTVWELLQLLRAAVAVSFPLEGRSLDWIAGQDARAAVSTYLEFSQNQKGQP